MTEIERMDRCVTALALELPGPVWDDVADAWQAVRRLLPVASSADTADLDDPRSNGFITWPDADTAGTEDE